MIWSDLAREDQVIYQITTLENNVRNSELRLKTPRQRIEKTEESVEFISWPVLSREVMETCVGGDRNESQQGSEVKKLLRSQSDYDDLDQVILI